MSNLNKMNKGLWWLYTQYILKKRFCNLKKKSIIFHPMRIDNPMSITLGYQVFIGEGAWLMGSGDRMNSLQIGDETTIGNHAHIIAFNDVEIGRKVLIADKVFISDCTHSYDNITIPIIDQKIISIGKVIIGEGSWLGENVCILGASVGKHSVIGSNSVVTKDIPDYCVAAGNPARVIKYYDFDKKEWVRR